MENIFSPLLEQAIELAAEWHDGTYRKGRWRDPAFEIPPEERLRVPVMAHLTAVALSVQRAGWDDATVAAAFLHDLLEDANRFRAEFTYGDLARLMGEEVARRVWYVTEEKYDRDGHHRAWQPRKDDYLARLADAPDEAFAISLADKLHNLWSINEALARGIDVFAQGAGRRALSAGPERQRWFYREVLRLADTRTEPRLVQMREELTQQMQRFLRLTGAKREA